MALGALVAVALAATPSWSIVVTRRVGIDPAKAGDLVEQLSRALNAVPGAPLGTLVPPKEFSAALAKGGFPDASVCSGSSACVANLGKIGGVDRVVALQLLKLGAEIALDATLLDTSGSVQGTVPLGAVTAQVPGANPGKKLEEIAAQLAAKAPAAVAAAPPPPPVQQPADAPKAAPELTPAPPQPPLVETSPPAKPLRYVSYGLAGGAVVSGGIGLALGLSAMSQANATKNTDPDFLERHNAAVGTARGADICYGVAAALAVTALVTFVLSRGD